MAIPFHGYNEGDEEEEQVMDKHEVVGEQVESSEVIGESGNQMLSEVQGESFVGQLLREFVGVYLRLSNNGRMGSAQSRGPGSNSTIYDSSCQSQNARPTMLPDLICCHVQSQSPVMLQNDDATRPLPDSLPPLQQYSNRPNNSPRTSPLPEGAIKNATDDLTSELSIDIKMCIDFSYQRIGRDLRQVADQLETTNPTNRRRRRHPAGNHHNHNTQTQITIKFELVIKFVIPATLIGLSLAFFKKPT